MELRPRGAPGHLTSEERIQEALGDDEVEAPGLDPGKSLCLMVEDAFLWLTEGHLSQFPLSLFLNRREMLGRARCPFRVGSLGSSHTFAHTCWSAFSRSGSYLGLSLPICSVEEGWSCWNPRGHLLSLSLLALRSVTQAWEKEEGALRVLG